MITTLPAPLEEASGLASSSGTGGALFVHEDSGEQARFHAVSRDGQLLVMYVLAGQDARDWEDMARGPDEAGRSSLWLGDVGDNNAGRERGLLVHRVPEPDPAADAGTVELQEVTSFRLVYADGPRDAEALLVHPRTGRLFVVTKELLRSPGLYAGPARLDPDGPNELRRLGDVALPATRTAGGPDLGGLQRALVTAGDIAPDGRRLALRTYTDVVEWPLTGDAPEDVAGALTGPATVTPLPATPQGEALAYTADGTGILVTSEGAQAPVHLLVREPPVQPPVESAGRRERAALAVVAVVTAGLLAWLALRRRTRSVRRGGPHRPSGQGPGR